mgnify:CR=1 FL=1
MERDHRNMRTRNIIAAIILLILGVGYAYLTAHLPSRDIANTTDPSFFPWVLAVCFLVLSGALLFQTFLPVDLGRLPSIPAIPVSKYAAGFVTFIVYMALLPTLGFVVANILFFAVLMIIYGERRPLWIAAGSIGLSLVLFFLFREIFQIRLPAGVLGGIIT